MRWPNRTLSLEVKPSILFILAALGVCYAFQLGWWRGLAATLMIALSLLLHELAHVLVAFAHGVKVKRIGFAAAGGYTVRESSGKWWVEAQSSAAGPMVNLLLFLAFSSVGGGVARVVAMANLILGIGNLIPLPRSDGARLWKAVFSRERATMVAVPAPPAVPANPHVVEAAGIGREIPPGH